MGANASGRIDDGGDDIDEEEDGEDGDGGAGAGEGEGEGAAEEEGEGGEVGRCRLNSAELQAESRWFLEWGRPHMDHCFLTLKNRRAPLCTI